MADYNLVPVIQRVIYRSLDDIFRSTALSPFQSNDYVAIKTHQTPIMEKFLTYVGLKAKWECLTTSTPGVLPNGVPGGEHGWIDKKIRDALVLQVALWMKLIATHQPPRLPGRVVMPPHPGKCRREPPSSNTVTTSRNNAIIEALNPECDHSPIGQNVKKNLPGGNLVAASSGSKDFSSDLDVNKRPSSVHDSLPRTTNKRKRLSYGLSDSFAQRNRPQPRYANDDLIEDSLKHSSPPQASLDNMQRLSWFSTSGVAEQQAQNDGCDEEYDCIYSNSEEEETSAIEDKLLLAVGRRSSCLKDSLQDSAQEHVRGEPISCQPQIFTLLTDIRQQIRLCLLHLKHHSRKEFIKIKALNPSALQAFFVDIAATLSITKPSHSIEDVIDALSHRDDLWESELENIDVRPGSAESAAVKPTPENKLPGLSVQAAKPSKARRDLHDKALDVWKEKHEKAPQGERKAGNVCVVRASAKAAVPSSHRCRSARTIQTSFEQNESLYLPLLANLKKTLSLSTNKSAVQNSLLEILTKLPDMTGPFIEAYGLIELVSLTEPFDATFHATVRDAIKEHMKEEQKMLPPGFKSEMVLRKSAMSATLPNPRYPSRKDGEMEGVASYLSSTRVPREKSLASKDPPPSTNANNSKPSAANYQGAMSADTRSRTLVADKSVSRLLRSEWSNLKGLPSDTGTVPWTSIAEIDFRFDASPITKWDSIPGVLVSPQSNDVLIGCGRSCFDHPGNIRLRLVITHLLDTLHQMKSRTARFQLKVWILNDVLRRNGRFLKMDRVDVTEWSLGGYVDAHIKVDSAVRDNFHTKVKRINLMEEEIDDAPNSSNVVPTKPVLDKVKATSKKTGMMQMDVQALINNQMRGIIARRRAIETAAKSDPSYTRGVIHTDKSAKVSEVPIED